MYTARALTSNANDTYACYKIVKDLWGKDVADSFSREMSDGFDYPSNWPPYYCVAEYDGQIVGCAGYRRALIMSDTWEFTWNNIHKDHQRKGVGGLLIDYRVEQIKKRGGKLIMTMAKYEPFNASRGFQTVQVIDGWFLMIKKLGSVSITG